MLRDQRRLRWQPKADLFVLVLTICNPIDISADAVSVSILVSENQRLRLNREGQESDPIRTDKIPLLAERCPCIYGVTAQVAA